jgi:single-strand DNA-binding protein
MNLNKVFLLGRLTKDPEAKTTPAGQTVCKFSLATSRTWTNMTTNQKEEKTEFHNIVLWRRLAEIATQYLRKGSLVLIEGRIQNRSYQDAAGVKKYISEVVAENMQMGPKSAGSTGYSAPAGMPTVGNFAKKNNKPVDQKPTEEEIPIIEAGKEDDIDVSQIPF